MRLEFVYSPHRHEYSLTTTTHSSNLETLGTFARGIGGQINLWNKSLRFTYTGGFAGIMYRGRRARLVVYPLPSFDLEGVSKGLCSCQERRVSAMIGKVP